MIIYNGRRIAVKVFGEGFGGAVVSFFDGENLISSQYVKSVEELIVPENPTKESTAQYDYNFLGWSLDGVNVLTSFIAPVGASEVSYYAVFEEVAKLDTLVNLANWTLGELDPLQLQEFY